MVKKLVLALLLTAACTFAKAWVLEGGVSPKDTVHPKSLLDRIDSYSEQELINLIDSLTSENTIPCDLIVKINNLIAQHESRSTKNDFGNFSIYPADQIYGNWNTRILFPYKTELSKYDSTIEMNLTGGSFGEFSPPILGPVTSPFGWRDSAEHKGIDIDLNRGDAVHCAFDGMVRIAEFGGGYGNVVIVRHFNGLETLYGHLWKIKVKPGDFVFAGQVVGLGGSTGHSTGTHLHFETRYKGVAINPKYLIAFEDSAIYLKSGRIELKKTRWGYTAHPAGEEIRVVTKGETIFDIARQYGLSLPKLKQLNGYTRYPRLRAGDKVRVKEGVAAPTGENLASQPASRAK